MADILEGFAYKLRKARDDKGYTQAEVGNRVYRMLDRETGAERGKQAVSRWETLKVEPGMRELVALCDVLDVTPNELLGFREGLG